MDQTTAATPQAQAALMYDAVSVVTAAIRRLRSRLGDARHGAATYCDLNARNTSTWKHGEEVARLMRQVRQEVPRLM